MISKYLKISFASFFVFSIGSIFAQTLPTQIIPPSIQFGSQKSYTEFLGSLKIDSSFVIPSRVSFDTIANVYRVAGSIFFNINEQRLFFYDGRKFNSILSGNLDGKYWNLGGNKVADGDSAIGTKDDKSLVLLQNNLKKFVITRDGYVGINNEAPQSHLDVNGIIRAKGARFDRMLSATLPSTYSDMRFKTDVQKIPNALEKILQLEGVSYFLNTEAFPTKGFSDKKQIGLIAQQVEKVLPELVQDESDGYKSVSYTMLTPYFVEAIKQQAKEISELKNELKIQQMQIEKILSHLKISDKK